MDEQLSIVDDFLSYMNGPGESAVDFEATLPISENIPLNEYVKTPTVAKQVFSTGSVSLTDKEQDKKVFSYCTGSGEVPPGFKPAQSCANCEYFCGGASQGHCYKYSFPCSSNYVCDSFEKCYVYILEDDKEYYAVDYDFSKLTDEKVQLLSEALEGNYKQYLLDKEVDVKTVTSQLYVYDQDSAKLASNFIEYIKGSKTSFIKLLKSFSVDVQIKLDPQPLIVNNEKQPSNQLLFKLAQNTDSVNTYSTYEALYETKYGSLDKCYLNTLKDVEVESVEVESVNVVEPAIEDPIEPVQLKDVDSQLREVARKRVAYRTKLNVDEITEQDVSDELIKIKEARGLL